MTEEKVLELAKSISNFANTSWRSQNEMLAKELVNDHPTLIQGKMALFVSFVREVAAIPYFDARDEASGNLAKAILEKCADLLYLPLI